MGSSYAKYVGNSASLETRFQSNKVLNNFPRESGSKLIDFAAFENESAIERRKRIMSGDRRTSYIMKLDALRRAQALKENVINETVEPNTSLHKEKKHSDTSETNSCCTKFHKNVATSSNFTGQVNGTNIVDKTLKSDDGNKSTITRTFPDLQKTNLKQCEQLLFHSPELNYVQDTTKCNNIANIIYERQERKMRTISLPNQLEHFNNIYDHDPTFNITKNEQKANTELQSKLFIPEQLNLEMIAVSPKPDESVIQSNSDSKRHKFYGILQIPVEFLTYCFNVTAHDIDSPKISKPDKQTIQSPNYKGICNFKSELSSDRFDSDLKASIDRTSTPDSLNSSINVNDEKTASLTFLAYKRVKSLFQTRIAKMQQEEMEKDTSIKDISYKELEDSGRDRIQSGVTVPFGNDKNIQNLFE